MVMKMMMLMLSVSAGVEVRGKTDDSRTLL